MNWPTVQRVLPVRAKRRRPLLHLFAVLLLVPVLIPRTAGTVHADTGSCPTSTGCPSYAPPDLLNLNQSLYAASPAQVSSLQNLEDQAVKNTIADHGLATTDTNAVKSWGRYDAEAELFGLLLQAVKASACTSGQTPGQGCRTTDQQNAVDWLAAVEQRQAVAAAQDAGLEYVKWAGLDQSAYQQLLNNSATTESDLQTFLSGPVQTYSSHYGNVDGGYCVYRSPAPYASEYTGYNDQTCYTPCTSLLGCNPPTPSYDQFTKWGEADANYSLLTSAQYVEASGAIAVGLGFAGAAVGAGLTGAALSSALSGVLVGSALQEAIFPFLGKVMYDGALTAAETGELAGEVTASSVGAIASIAIVAITIAVMEGITVVNAAQLPGKLATLISNARTTTLDPAALLNDSNGASSLFSLFVGATLPVPTNQTCDNSNTSSEPGLTVTGGKVIIGNVVPCLNPTAIPPASPTDPYFLVQAKGATTKTASSTISVKDTAIGTTTTARLSGNWFIAQLNGSTSSVQALRISYTDWNGTEQNAWMMGNPTDGYHFVGFAVLSGTSTPVDPSTCLANGVCWQSPSIDYVGSDGNDYAASVQRYTPPHGSPSYSTAVEGSPVTVYADDFGPGSATAPITYQWEFQSSNCVPGSCLWVNGSPPYTAPVSGDTATYTWQAPGPYQVRLTATDANGVQATDTFTVTVADVPPRLSLDPACASNPSGVPVVCDQQTAEVGASVSLGGALTHAGTLDKETVAVNWDEGCTVTPQNWDRCVLNPGIFCASVGGGIGDPQGLSSCAGQYIDIWPTTLDMLDGQPFPLTLTASSSDNTYTLSDSHTYVMPGIYYGTVSVYDRGGGTDAKRFTEIIWGTPTVTWKAPAAITYGTPLSATQLDASAAYKTASVPGSFAYTADGNPVAAGQVLSVGRHTLTASFTPTDPHVYQAPAPTSVTLTVNPAPLTVTANNQVMVQGGTVPSFTASSSDLVNHDSLSSIGVSCAAHDRQGNPVSSSTPIGAYPITCGGSPSNYTPTFHPGTLFITQQAVKLTGSATSTNGSVSLGGSSGSPGSLALTGSGGSGTLALAQYSSNPGPADAFNTTNSYFGATIAPGSTFTSLQLVNCNLGGGNMVYWFNGSSWVLASKQSYDPSTHCVTVTINASTIPSLSQLNGSFFGVLEDVTPPTTRAHATLGSGTSAYVPGNWTNQLVKVALSAQDNPGGSGLAATYYRLDGGAVARYTAGSAITVSSQGKHTLAFWSTDNAGNVEEQTAASNSMAIDIDTTPPTITASATTADGKLYSGAWTNQSVTIHFSCADQPGLSGIESCPAPVTVSTQGKDQHVTGTAWDAAGNSSSATVSGINVDTTPPSIKGSATTADGKSYSGAWTNQSVTVRFTCADQPDLSGIKSCPAPVTVSTEGANQQVRGTAGDVAGNSSSTAVGDINIDLTKPIVTYTGNAGSYTVDQTIAITCAASDSVHNGVSSGLASTTCQNVHAPAYTFTLGSHTFSATATDKAGNAGSGSTSFVVKDTVAGLSTLTKEYVTNQQIANSLCTLLSQQKYAGYIALVQSYSHDSQLITPAHAALLIQLAQAL